MLINCDTCSIRPTGCSDCLVNLLFEAPTQGFGLLPAEWEAVQRFVLAGLMQPLRHPSDVQIKLSESA